MSTPKEPDSVAEMRAWLRDISVRPEWHQAASILAAIPADTKHESGKEARRYAGLAQAAMSPLEAARNLIEAVAAWKDYMLWDTAMKGDKFSKGKPKGSLGQVAKKIKEYLKKHPKAKPKEVWDALQKAPPKGFSFKETDRLGRYIEEDDRPAMEYRRFQNLVSEHRPKQ